MAIDLIRITVDRIRANDRFAIEELQKTNKVLRQLDRNKLEFIMIAAHELRTPLTVLNGYVNLMRTLPETQANPIGRGHRRHPQAGRTACTKWST